MTEIIVPIHLRWGDMDVYGHINNVAYAQYMEQSRVQLMAYEGFAPTSKQDSHIVARNEIDYLVPLKYQADPVHMHLWIEKLGAATYTVGYELHNGDVVHMRAKTRMITYDLEANAPRRIQENLRVYLNAALRD